MAANASRSGATLRPELQVGGDDSTSGAIGLHRGSDRRQAVMRQSLFADDARVLPEANLVGGATSPLVSYALAGAALLVALIALGVALLK